MKILFSLFALVLSFAAHAEYSGQRMLSRDDAYLTRTTNMNDPGGYLVRGSLVEVISGRVEYDPSYPTVQLLEVRVLSVPYGEYDSIAAYPGEVGWVSRISLTPERTTPAVPRGPRLYITTMHYLLRDGDTELPAGLLPEGSVVRAISREVRRDPNGDELIEVVVISVPRGEMDSIAARPGDTGWTRRMYTERN